MPKSQNIRNENVETAYSESRKEIIASAWLSIGTRPDSA